MPANWSLQLRSDWHREVRGPVWGGALGRNVLLLVEWGTLKHASVGEDKIQPACLAKNRLEDGCELVVGAHVGAVKCNVSNSFCLRTARLVLAQHVDSPVSAVR